MKKNIIILLLFCFCLISGCGRKNENLSQILSKTYDTQLTVINTYKENTLTYAVISDSIGNYCRLAIDVDGNIIYQDEYDNYLKDLEIKQKIEEILPDSKALYVQYNINKENVCDIYLYTDYIVDLTELTKKILEFNDCDIVYHIATTSTQEELVRFNGIIRTELSQSGIITSDIENLLSRYVKDYKIITVERTK